MACPICCNDYYSSKTDDTQSVVSGSTTSSSNESCAFICDTGQQCKLKRVNEDLCGIHASYRTKLVCPSCGLDCCRICYRTYFLSSPEEPQCMFKECKKGFSIEYLLGYDGHIQRFTNRFVWGPLKEHREDVLLDQILARLPTFQLIVTEQVSKERYKEKMAQIDQRIKDIQLQNAQIIRNIVVLEEYDVNNEQLYLIISRNQLRLAKLHEFKEQLYRKHHQYPAEKKDDEEKIHKTHGNCLKRNEGCNGFINHEWECGVCFTKVCSKCHNLKEKDHECDPNEVESIKALKDISKPCPGCNTMIERTMGCSQMWCTNCHNFFDWNTLKIIKKTQYTHNPEHLAWVTKNSKTLGNVEGPAEVNVCDIQFHHITSLPISEEAKQLLSETLRICNEIRDEVQAYRDPLEKNIEKHAVDFLRSKITKNDLKKLVQRNYKSSKKTEFANMHRTMYIDAARNTLVFSVNEIKRLSQNYTVSLNESQKQQFNAGVLKPSTVLGIQYSPQVQEEIDTVLQNTFTVLNNLRDYTEKNLKTLGDLFNSEKPHLSNTSVRSEFNGKKFVTQFLKTLYKIRTEGFYMDWGTRNIFYKLTGARSETDLITFLRNNPDWIPNEEEILKVKAEYDRGG